VSSNFFLLWLRFVATEQRYVDHFDTFYVTTGDGGYNNLLVRTMFVPQCVPRNKITLNFQVADSHNFA